MSKVFISYRRADSLTITGRIHDRLVTAFGEQNIFKDVDDIEPGVDFRQVILDAIDESDVLLVIIGKKWLDLRNAQGERRLDEPNDFVRMEVQTGLEKAGLRVIPVLVSGAFMPDTSSLPDVLKELAFKNAMVVREDPDFNDDVNILIDAVERVLKEKHNASGRRWMVGLIALLLMLGGMGAFLLSQTGSSAPESTPVAALTQDATDEAETATPMTDEPETPPTDPAAETTETATPPAEATDATPELTPENRPETTPETTPEITEEGIFLEPTSNADGAFRLCEITLNSGFAAVNARSGPSPEFRVVRRIAAGERVEVIGRQRANASGFFWWQTIEDTWVFNGNVTAEGDCDDVPIVSFSS